MFEFAILYIIFNMATSNLNKLIIYNKKRKKLTFLPKSCNNENKLKVTYQFPLAKGTFN